MPPDRRFVDPYAPGSLAQAVRTYCDRFDVRPLRLGSVFSGGSSRNVQPGDVVVRVTVRGPGQIVVREQLRPGLRSTRQATLATVAMLLLVVVAVASAAVGWRRRMGR